jgi:WD40 repeat protein
MSSEVINELQFSTQPLCRMDDYVASIDFSFDGRFVGAASVSGEASVHGLDGNGFVFAAHTGDTTRIRFSPTAHELATGGIDGAVRIWNHSGVLIAEEVRKGWCNDIAWRPTGGEVVGVVGRSVVRVLSNGLNGMKHQELDATGECVGWNSDGRRLFVGAYGGVLMFQSDARAIREYPWKGAPLVVRISPDDKWIATGNQDSSLHCWKISNGADLQMTGFETKVQNIAWDSSSRYLANASFDVISIWDFSGKGPKGRTPIDLSGHAGRIIGLGYLKTNPDILVSGATDGGVCVWRPTPKGRSLIARYDTGMSLTALAVSPVDSCIALGTEDGDVLTLDIAGLE